MTRRYGEVWTSGIDQLYHNTLSENDPNFVRKRGPQRRGLGCTWEDYAAERDRVCFLFVPGDYGFLVTIGARVRQFAWRARRNLASRARDFNTAESQEGKPRSMPPCLEFAPVLAVGMQP